ncbi:hypothetical protein BDZ97DRAFT_243012 [Flammula alnicola]|nr:hypothetical protein BDZ97DRAFT_243012 [Flammula alnicola]
MGCGSFCVFEPLVGIEMRCVPGQSVCSIQDTVTHLMNPGNATPVSGLSLGTGVIDISQSAAQGGRISTVQVLRRSLRSTVSNTASELREDSHKCLPRWPQLKRRSLARPKKGLPLSEDPIQSSNRTRDRRKPGAATARAQTQIAVASEVKAPSTSTPKTLHAYPHVSDHVGASGSTDRIPANVLLSMAQQSVELQMDWFGRKPCVMDVILDLQDVARGSTEALTTACGGTFQFNEDLQQDPILPRTYTFCDERSLSTYWTDQAAIWASVQVSDNDRDSTDMGFPESGERSTARWSSLLNCEEDDVTSVCSGRVSTS